MKPIHLGKAQIRDKPYHEIPRNCSIRKNNTYLLKGIFRHSYSRSDHSKKKQWPIIFLINTKMYKINADIFHSTILSLQQGATVIKPCPFYRPPPKIHAQSSKQIIFLFLGLQQGMIWGLYHSLTETKAFQWLC